MQSTLICGETGIAGSLQNVTAAPAPACVRACVCVSVTERIPAEPRASGA